MFRENQNINIVNKNGEKCLAVSLILPESDKTTQSNSKNLLRYCSDLTLSRCLSINGMNGYFSHNISYMTSGEMLAKTLFPFISGISWLFYKRLIRVRGYSRKKSLLYGGLLFFSLNTITGLYFSTSSELVFQAYLEKNLGFGF